MTMDRRTFMMAGSATLLGSSGNASAGSREEPVFKSGPLARNDVARSFLTVPRTLTLPRLALTATDGRHSLDELKGKVRIIALWAEWCTPCLAEAEDLSILRRKFAGARFDVLAVLTAGRSNLTHSQAQAKLAGLGASTPTWVEPANGREIGKALAIVDPPHISLPCNLLVDGFGRVRGRSVGNGLQSRNGEKRSQWASPEAAAFVSALVHGALDRIA
jgi:thiol-disulfide isomerase/thioredoxin